MIAFLAAMSLALPLTALVAVFSALAAIGAVTATAATAAGAAAPQGAAAAREYEGTVVSVQVGSEDVHVMSSVTTPGAWETMTGVEPDDVVSVTISERGEA